MGPVLALGVGSSAGAPTPTVPDAFSPDVTIRAPDGWYDAPIHGTLLPDGQVLMWGKAWQSWPASATTAFRSAAWVLDPTPLGAPVPAQVTPEAVTEPLEAKGVQVGTSTVSDDLFCAGNSLTADGRVVISGGTRWIRSTATGQVLNALGVPYETVFEPTTDSWTVAGNFVGIGQGGATGRWYPTDTRLPDGNILVNAGWAEAAGIPNLSSEIFDPTTGTSTVATPSGVLPIQVLDEDYTHEWVLPYSSANFDLLEMGERGLPVFGSTKNPTEFDLNNPVRPDPGDPASAPSADRSSAMLEIRAINGQWGYANGSILVAGGTEGSLAASHADVFDPIAGAWKPTIDTGTPRSDPATVILPDGRALIVTGHDPADGAGALQAQYLDPANGFSLTNGTASMPDERGYHTVALLLPDGRVLVAGGRDTDTWSTYEKPTLEYYYPDYMFKPRPTIVQAPSTVGYNQGFLVVDTGSAPTQVVLEALGSMTHSFDQNQRVVQLPITKVVTGGGEYGAAVVSPHDGWVAPPGTYMLFVLGQNRAPSLAKMIHLG